MAKLKSARGSFQQLLLFAFLLITGLLVGVALRNWMPLHLLFDPS